MEGISEESRWPIVKYEGKKAIPGPGPKIQEEIQEEEYGISLYAQAMACRRVAKIAEEEMGHICKEEKCANETEEEMKEHVYTILGKYKERCKEWEMEWMKKRVEERDEGRDGGEAKNARKREGRSRAEGPQETGRKRRRTNEPDGQRKEKSEAETSEGNEEDKRHRRKEKKGNRKGRKEKRETRGRSEMTTGSSRTRRGHESSMNKKEKMEEEIRKRKEKARKEKKKEREAEEMQKRVEEERQERMRNWDPPMETVIEIDPQRDIWIWDSSRIAILSIDRQMGEKGMRQDQDGKHGHTTLARLSEEDYKKEEMRINIKKTRCSIVQDERIQGKVQVPCKYNEEGRYGVGGVL